MHGCSSGSAILVNAEVDSMGGVVDGGVGIGSKPSPRRAAIEKAQAELRQEYDVREERRRELEFLEKGGNPLDFKFGHAASVSVQSTSLTDQHPEQIVTSEAKGSFALTASPHGDSVESSGRPGGPAVCEPNSADNLLLFDGESEVLDRNTLHLSRRNIVPSEQSSQVDGGQNAKESEDSAIFRPYARRNRSRSNRDGARSSSADIVPSRGGHGSSLPARHGPRDVKGSISETNLNNEKDHNISLISNPKSASSNGDVVFKVVAPENQLDMVLDGVRAVEATSSLTKGIVPESNFDTTLSKWDNQHIQSLQVDTQQALTDVVSADCDPVGGREQAVSSRPECLPSAATVKSDNETSSAQLNGFGNLKRERKILPNEGQNSGAAFGTKGLDSESSCTQNSLSIDGNNDSDQCTVPKNVDSNGNPSQQLLAIEGTPNITGDVLVKEKNETKDVDGCAIINESLDSHQNHKGNAPVAEVEEEIHKSQSGSQNEVKHPSNIKGMEQNDQSVSNTDIKAADMPSDNSNPTKEGLSTARPQGSMDSPVCELSEATLSRKDSSAGPDLKICAGNRSRVMDKAHEDSILEEARIIEAKRKRIAELSVGVLPLEYRRKSHWDFVLEEMAWLANDFAQERLWKLTAAAQISYRVSFTSQLRFEAQKKCQKQKKVAHTLAKAVMEFWHSAEVLLRDDDRSVGPKNCKYELAGSRRIEGNEIPVNNFGEVNMEASKELEHPGKKISRAVQGYAVRFLKYNNSLVPPVQAEAPLTPERISDSGIVDMSWEDRFTEESLFYTVPAGAMETYRKSTESHLVQCEKTGSSMQEEVETSIYDAVAEFGSQENCYDEDEGETSTYHLLGGFEGNKASKYAQKKKRIKSYGARPYEMGSDFPYGHCTIGAQQSALIGKRPASSLNVGPIPTKRMRTASRQRVLSPFGTGATGCVQAPNKTDASSGDTSSFQDDQSTLHGGSQIQKSLEVESVVDFEKQLPFDSAEVSTKPKKKKKAKHLGSSYEQRWHLDSTVHNEQRDHSKKRSEVHHFESNGSSGLFGQHNAKKPKIIKHSTDNAFDNIAPMSGSIPSPVASQMSNMSNPNKLIRMIGVRDRGRKAKGLKLPAGQPGSGSPWSVFEDQALVVLVHDMGANWELVSDAINSTLQFKCIFRKPKECKERHKILMDRTTGDGADSAEDSGSSQPYPSTLPGIPKGSARQLFQHLQGPMLEETLKSHFEKIIAIGQQQHYRRSQNDNQEPKQLAPVHGSHVFALSQVCPNNLNGGPLTPLDLCDATTSSSDVISLGYQGSHSSGLAISNHGSVASMLPASGANSPLQGSSNVLGSNLSSPAGPLNPSVRDNRYAVPRATSLPVDEQQRMQQYSPMLSSRNVQQSSLPVPGNLQGTDRGVRMLAGGNSVGMVPGMNRNISMPRPGFPGIASSTMLNSGSMLSSSMVGMPSPVNMHSGATPSQGNSMFRPREALHMMRPGHNPEHQRQMMVPEHQMQVSQGNSQGVPGFNGIGSAFSNQTVPPVQPYPVHSQQQHQLSSQSSHVLGNPHHPLQGPNHTTSTQQAYAIRVAKERHLQQRMLQQQHQQQQQQQFASSNSLMSHVQPQPQHPMSSSVQNSSQIHTQTSQPVTLPPLTAASPMAPISSQEQPKHHLPPHGLNRNPQVNASGLTSQIGKPRQRQPQQQFQQTARHHPQQRQQSQPQPQPKLLKGMGRGNMMHHSLAVDPSHLNGLSTAPGSHATEKNEQVMHLMQGQSLYSGSGANPVQPGKPLVPPQPANQSQRPASTSSKQLQKMPLPENSNQGQFPAGPTAHATLSASHQTGPPSVISSNHQQTQIQQSPHHKQVNQTQLHVQRMLQTNRQSNSDRVNKSQADQAQVDPQSVNSSSQMNTTAASQTGMESSAGVTAGASQWKAPESLYDSGMTNPAAQVGSVGSPSMTSSVGGDPAPTISGSVQRQLSGSLPHGHNGGSQWQQQQLPQPSTPPSLLQQHQHQQQEQQPLQQSPQQQQQQHLQTGQSNMYIRPTNSRLE